MQIWSGREPNRLSRRPRLAHLFSIFLFLYLVFPLRQPSPPKLVFCYNFHFLCCFLSLSLTIPGIEEGTGDQCETVRNCNWRPHLFLCPLSWPFPHPSAPLLFSGHQRRDMQVWSGRQPNRLSRRPRHAHLFSLLCIVFISNSSYSLSP